MTIKTLSKDDILFLHEELINRYGGSHGVRDDKLLDSALAAPFQSFGGIELYPTIEDKAARLGFGLAVNHPFHDGNKRIGAKAMLALLDINGISLSCTSEELSDIFLSLASGTTDEAGSLDWLNSHKFYF